VSTYFDRPCDEGKITEMIYRPCDQGKITEMIERKSGLLKTCFFLKKGNQSVFFNPLF